MKRQDLVESLRQPYAVEAGCGVEKVDNPGYENIWFVVPPKPPSTVRERLPLGRLRDANRTLQARPTLRGASAIDNAMALLLIRREAVASSRMEGTWSTLDDVLTPERDPEARSATASVRGYAAAMVSGIDAIETDGLAALTPELISDLHIRVMAKDPNQYVVAGRIREPGYPGDIVQIGSVGRKEHSIYNPAPPVHVVRCLQDVIDWMKDPELIDAGDAGMGMTLPVRMAVGHAHFEAVHPFSDGNGRIGRMLWALQMAASDRLPLYLSSYVESEKTEYGEALQEAQKQLKYARLIEFVCNAIIACGMEEAVTASALEGLPSVWQERGRFRRGSSAARALELLLLKPIMTVQLLAAELGVSVEAASQGLKRLEAGGVVRDRSGRGRNRIYAAEEVTSVLSRPYASDIEVALASARERLL